MHELIIHLFEFQEICNLKYTLGRSPIVVDKVKIALADYPDKEAAFRLLHGFQIKLFRPAHTFYNAY